MFFVDTESYHLLFNIFFNLTCYKNKYIIILLMKLLVYLCYKNYL